jgi:HEAT repeat protein
MGGVPSVEGPAGSAGGASIQKQSVAFINLLKQPLSTNKSDAVDRFIENYPQAVIHTLLESHDYDNDSMSYYMLSLVGTKHGKKFTDAAVKALKSGDAEKRARAFFILNGRNFKAYKDRIAFPEKAVRAALKDANPLVRQRALDSLSRYHWGDKKEIIPLALKALNDKSPKVRQNAARTIWYLTNMKLPASHKNNPAKLDNKFGIVQALTKRAAEEKNPGVLGQINQALKNF